MATIHKRESGRQAQVGRTSWPALSKRFLESFRRIALGREQLLSNAFHGEDAEFCVLVADLSGFQVGWRGVSSLSFF